MQTLGAFLIEAGGRFADRPALLYKPRYRTEVWTYAGLLERSRRVELFLRKRGIEQGDRVVIWAPNSPWWVAAYFGCLRMGAILVPLDVRSNSVYVERIVEQTSPKLAFLARLTASEWRYAAPTMLLEDLAMLPEVTDSAVAAGSEVAPDDVAEVIFTSGTTGDPKGVILSHANITSNAESAMHVIPHSPDYRLISLLPLSHMFEQTVGLLLPLRCGASVYYPAGRQSTMLFRDFKAQGITTILAVPQAFALFMAAIEREVKKQKREAAWAILHRIAPPLPLRARRLLFKSVHQRLGGRLRFLVSGGAPLQPDLIQAWARLGLPMIQGYGATEASPIISGTTLRDRPNGSVGRAVPGVEIRLAEDGEVLVRGPNITRGYWSNARATADAFQDGWYRTGDLGRLEADGTLYLQGRKKDLIVLPNGQNVYPADVENALQDAGDQQDAVVVGMPGPQGAQVHAVLVGVAPSTDPAAVVRKANAILAPHQQIQGYTVWPEPDFPRTHTLKVKKQEVLRALVERPKTQDRPAAAPMQETSQASPLLRLIAELSGCRVAELTPEATLSDGCGLDSLGRVELLAAVEAELGVYLDESQIGPDTSVAEVEALVRAQESSTRPEFPRWPLSPLAGVLRSVVQAPIFAALDRVTPTTISQFNALDGIAPPVLFVANHTSHLDAPSVLRALPPAWRRRVAVAAAADYFFTRTVAGAGVALALNAFPFSREGNIRPTIEHCAWLLDHGWSILIFPEGTRSTSGEIGPFKAGAGLLAVELGVPVVPIHLRGLHDILPKGRRWPRQGRVTARMGMPLRFNSDTAYPEAASTIEAALRVLSAE